MTLLSPRQSKAIVLCVEGERYRRQFNRLFFPNINHFGASHGYDVIVVPGEKIRATFGSCPMDRTLAGMPSSWLKLFAIQEVQSRGYSRVLFLDADIFVSPSAIDYFSLLPDDVVSAVIEATIPVEKICLWRSACSLDPNLATSMINGGVLYLAGNAGREAIATSIAFTKNHAREINFRNRVFEQPVLSEFLLNHPSFKRMRYTYNSMYYAERGVRAPEVQKLRSSINKVCQKIPVAQSVRHLCFSTLCALPTRYASENQRVLSELISEGRFIHFAGMNDEWCLLRALRRKSAKSEVISHHSSHTSVSLL